jgi:hypothetical protein
VRPPLDPPLIITTHFHFPTDIVEL